MFIARTKLYGCVVGRSDYLERIEGGGYDQEEYEQFPDRYKSTFNKKVCLPMICAMKQRLISSTDNLN